MPRRPEQRIMFLRRFRALEREGGYTLYFTLGHTDELFSRAAFVSPERVPAFEGDTAWARVDWWSKSRHAVVEIVADKRGAPLPPTG